MFITAIRRRLLLVLDAFLAVTAVAGGTGLLTGLIAPPVALLRGSPFSSYTIPGLILMVVVGGSALTAAVLILLRHRLDALISGLAGVMIMGFETVEVLVVGSQPGPARNLQVFYFALGLAIIVLAAPSLIGADAAERFRLLNHVLPKVRGNRLTINRDHR